MRRRGRWPTRFPQGGRRHGGDAGEPRSRAQLAVAQPAAQQNQPQRKPAENLIRELYEGLNAEQRRRVVYPFDHGAGQNQTATRMRMYNAPIFANHTIGGVYTQAQQELNSADPSQHLLR
jgi:hypothetical protein